jgi:Uma2 family endonuclease
MLDDDLILLLPTEEDLPDSDEKPVDNELQLLAPVLLRSILAYIWGSRFDWFFGVNLGLYYDVTEPAIGPDGFLSLGVQRVRPDNKLRLSYVVAQEKVMPQWVLEVVSKKPGGEYGAKFDRYAAIGVLYYTIYNPSHYRRDKHDSFEVYKLEDGRYVRQVGNPVWMPEIGLGIGLEFGLHEGIIRDWLYWYDELGNRYPGPEEALQQERISRERSELMRRSAEERLEREVEQERRTIARNLLAQGVGLEIVAQATGLTIEELKEIKEQSL